MNVSLSELKTNPGKYIDLTQQQDIHITRRGRKVAKLVSTADEKVAALKSVFGILPPTASLEQARKERHAERFGL